MSNENDIIFMGLAKNEKSFLKFIGHDKESGRLPWGNLFKLGEVDNDGLDFQFWDKSIDKNTALEECSKSRFSGWGKLHDAIQNGFSVWQGDINCLFCVRNSFSAHELNPGKIFESKTYGKFLFITHVPEQWGKDDPGKYTIRPRTHYLSLIGESIDDVTDVDIYNTMIIDCRLSRGGDPMTDIITGEFDSDLDIVKVVDHVVVHGNRHDEIMGEARYLGVVENIKRLA